MMQLGVCPLIFFSSQAGGCGSDFHRNDELWYIWICVIRAIRSELRHRLRESSRPVRACLLTNRKTRNGAPPTLFIIIIVTLGRRFSSLDWATAAVWQSAQVEGGHGLSLYFIAACCVAVGFPRGVLCQEKQHGAAAVISGQQEKRKQTVSKERPRVPAENFLGRVLFLCFCWRFCVVCY